MRLAFMGSPSFSVPALRAVVEAGHEVVAVYCQPPRAAGRGQRETPCPVHLAAVELGLTVHTPRWLRKDVAGHHAFAALALDAAVVAAYGLLLPPAMLASPRRGCLNIHASLLPRWRGAAPIQAAILAGDAQTGITIMQMDTGLDTGAILLAEDVSIDSRDTTADLHDRLSGVGARLILRALDEDPAPIPQPEQGATYASKLSKGDAVLDWRDAALALERRVRAMHPWPGAQFRFGAETIRVLEAEETFETGVPGTVLDDAPRVACGRGALRLRRLQRPGRKPQDAAAFLRGHAMPPGTILP